MRQKRKSAHGKKLKADREGKAKPEIIRPADNECKTCDGNIRALYTKMRESKEVENEISEEPRGSKGFHVE